MDFKILFECKAESMHFNFLGQIVKIPLSKSKAIDYPKV